LIDINEQLRAVIIIKRPNMKFFCLSLLAAVALAQTTEDPKDVPTVEMKFC